MLDGPSNPVSNVLGKFQIAARDNFDDRPVDQAPISRRRFTSPSLPEVETVINNWKPSRKKQNSSVLATITIVKPPLAKWHFEGGGSALAIWEFGGDTAV